MIKRYRSWPNRLCAAALVAAIVAIGSRIPAYAALAVVVFPFAARLWQTGVDAALQGITGRTMLRTLRLRWDEIDHFTGGPLAGPPIPGSHPVIAQLADGSSQSLGYVHTLAVYRTGIAEVRRSNELNWQHARSTGQVAGNADLE